MDLIYAFAPNTLNTCHQELTHNGQKFTLVNILMFTSLHTYLIKLFAEFPKVSMIYRLSLRKFKSINICDSLT